jgi:hypothetical protein
MTFVERLGQEIRFFRAQNAHVSLATVSTIFVLLEHIT